MTSAVLGRWKDTSYKGKTFLAKEEMIEVDDYIMHVEEAHALRWCDSPNLICCRTVT